jgi:hypothetical protein
MTAYQSVLAKIQSLSVERHQLYLLASKQELSAAKRRRLEEIKERLDALWLTRKTMRTSFYDPLEGLINSSWTRGRSRG